MARVTVQVGTTVRTVDITASSPSAGEHVNPAITKVVQGVAYPGDLDLHEVDSGTEFRDCTIGGTLGITPSGSGVGPHDLKFTRCTARQLFQRASSSILFVDTKISGPIKNTQNQIKGYNGAAPTNIEFLRCEVSHVTRDPGVHVEGLYVFAMINGWFTNCHFYECDVMDLNFQSDVVDNTGRFGPISNILVKGGTYAAPTPSGYNCIYVSADGTTAPKNVVIDRTGMTYGGSIYIEPGAAANGCKQV